MADRVSASIVIGGTITAAVFAELARLIDDERLSTEWDGGPFQPADCRPGESLSLYAHEVPWGRFEELEAFCIASGVAFARWSGAYSGQWNAERVVFTGTGEAATVTTDEDDHVVINRHTVEELGSIAAIKARFDAADFAVPPLTVSESPTGD